MKGQSPSLEELQKWMRWVITDPRGASVALREPPALNLPHRNRYLAPSKDCFTWIEASSGASPGERLDIYAEAYFARLLESLSADFESLLRVLGEEAFTRLIADYLKAYPSHEKNIGEVGRHLGSFLKSHDFSEDLPFLPDLALLESAVIESFYADDVPPLPVSILTEISAEEWPLAQFQLDPSVVLLESEWAVGSLWLAQNEEETQLALELLDPSLFQYLLFRHEGIVQVQDLSQAQFQMLLGMKLGQNLNELCEKLETLSQDSPPLMEWFQQWALNGIIRKIEIKEKGKL